MVEASFPAAEKVQKYYSWRASNYDAGASFEVEHHAEALRLANVQAGQHVLDVGCGTGRGTVGLAQAVGSTGRVDALDLPQAMLDRAQSKLDGLGLSGRVHLQHTAIRAAEGAESALWLILLRIGDVETSRCRFAAPFPAVPSLPICAPRRSPFARNAR